MSNRKLTKFIEQHQLFEHNDKVLVALSGGADSVALLCMLHEEGYTCEAAHCNFHLRADESDRDEEFVKMLCQRLQVKLHIKHFQTAAIANEKKISIEMAARELRYEWFEQLRIESHSQAVAVAHHQDDNVETMLLNLLRGTGIQGIRGMRPKNGCIVRPLLSYSRKEIISYLNKIGQTYVTDSTNLEDEFTRNKIRLRLLPLMEEINPATREHLLATANYLNGAIRIYEKEIQKAIGRVCKGDNICISSLLNEASPESILYELLYPKGFNQHQIADIMNALVGQSGKQFFSQNWQVLKDREWLMVSKREASLLPTLIYNRVKREKDFSWTTDKQTAYLDAEKLTLPLELRKWQAGDWFIPLGMKGKKLVSDFMTDRKFNRWQKEQQCVLCCGKNIVWLVGERIDQRYSITNNTQEIVIAKIKN